MTRPGAGALSARMTVPADAAAPDTQGTTVILLRRGLVLAFLWGGVAVGLLRGLLFRRSNPDLFYVGSAAAAALFGSALLWFPSRLTMTPGGFTASVFGITTIRFPWRDVASMTLLRRQTGRFLGLQLHRGLKPEKGVRRFSPWDGYDVLLSSRWEVPLDRVAQAAAAYWRAQGGSGVINDTITTSDFTRRITDTPER